MGREAGEELDKQRGKVAAMGGRTSCPLYTRAEEQNVMVG